MGEKRRKRMAQHYNPLPQSDLAPQPQQYGGSPAPQYYVVDELPAGAVPLNVAQPPQYAAQPQPMQQKDMYYGGQHAYEMTPPYEAQQEFVKIDYVTPIVLACIALAGVWPCAIVAIVLSRKNMRKIERNEAHPKYKSVLLASRIAVAALIMYAILFLVFVVVYAIEVRYIMHMVNQGSHHHRRFAKILQMQL